MADAQQQPPAAAADAATATTSAAAADAKAAPAAAEPFTICVYCGSRPGERAEYMEVARAMGRRMGARGWQLVYGGGCTGLMGAVADATLAAGGRAIGVIPESLVQLEVGHTGLSEPLKVVKNMHQRKQLMAERADAFVALPGGVGTFEELFETWSWRCLDYHDRPIAVLDVASGFWKPFLSLLTHCQQEGFISGKQMAVLMHETYSTDADIDRLLDVLEEAARGAVKRLRLGDI